MKTFYVRLKRETEHQKEMFLKHPESYIFAFFKVKMGLDAIKVLIYIVSVFSPLQQNRELFPSQGTKCQQTCD